MLVMFIDSDLEIADLPRPAEVIASQTWFTSVPIEPHWWLVKLFENKQTNKEIRLELSLYNALLYDL